jgi:hypothetical protein
LNPAAAMARNFSSRATQRDSSDRVPVMRSAHELARRDAHRQAASRTANDSEGARGVSTEISGVSPRREKNAQRSTSGSNDAAVFPAQVRGAYHPSWPGGSQLHWGRQGEPWSRRR